MNEKVSVITVVRNDKTHIEETIQSVLSQDSPKVEYLVIDGNSTDGTVEICKKYRNKIENFVSEADDGIYNAMNKGLKLATGDWIFFLNSGDTFYDKSVISNIFNTKLNSDIIYGKSITKDGRNCYFPKKVTKLMFMLERMVCHQSIFARKSTFTDNYFNESYRIIADRFWLYNCFSKHKRIIKKNCIISVYDTNGISSNWQRADAESLKFLQSISRFAYFVGKCKRIMKGLLKK